MARHKMSARGSGAYFTKNAMRTNTRNLLGMPMRGGIRL